MTATERALLDALDRAGLPAGALEQVMVDVTGLSPTRCWQTVNRLLDHPGAWDYAPAVCRRLDARRSQRRRKPVRFGHEEAPQ